MVDYSSLVPRQEPVPAALLGEHLEQFLDYCAVVRDCLPSTVTAYGVDLGVFRRFLEGRSAQSVSLSLVCDFVAYLKQEKANSQAAVHRKIATLTAFFDYLVVMQAIPARDHPLCHFPRLRHIADRKLPVVLSESEMQRILAAISRDTIQGIRDTAIITLFYNTAVRVSELCAIRLPDLDHENGKILIHGKGGRERLVPITAECAVALAAWLAVRPPLEGNDALFTSKKENRLSQRAVQALVARYAGAAGIRKRVSPHKLRHTCATHLLQHGAELHVISELLGHRNLGTTRIYLHITLQDVKDAMAYHPLRLLAALNDRPVTDRRKLAYQGKYQRVA